MIFSNTGLYPLFKAQRDYWLANDHGVDRVEEFAIGIANLAESGRDMNPNDWLPALDTTSVANIEVVKVIALVVDAPVCHEERPRLEELAVQPDRFADNVFKPLFRLVFLVRAHEDG